MKGEVVGPMAGEALCAHGAALALQSGDACGWITRESAEELVWRGSVWRWSANRTQHGYASNGERLPSVSSIKIHKTCKQRP
jgi:hypothetical protein